MGALSSRSTTTPTTTPVASARLAADADERDRPPGGREQRTLGLRRGVADAGQDYLDRGVPIPGDLAGVFDAPATGDDLRAAARRIGDQPARR